MWLRCELPQNVKSLHFLIYNSEKPFNQPIPLRTPLYVIFIPGKAEVILAGVPRNAIPVPPKPKGSWSSGEPAFKRKTVLKSWFWIYRHFKLERTECWRSKGKPTQLPRRTRGKVELKGRCDSYSEVAEPAKANLRQAVAFHFGLWSLGGEEGHFPIVVPPHFQFNLNHIQLRENNVKKLRVYIDGADRRFQRRFPDIRMNCSFILSHCVTESILEHCWENETVAKLPHITKKKIDSTIREWIGNLPINQFTVQLEQSPTEKKLNPTRALIRLQEISPFRLVPLDLIATPICRQRLLFRKILTFEGIMVDPNYVEVAEHTRTKYVWAYVPVIPWISINNSPLLDHMSAIVQNDGIFSSFPTCQVRLPIILCDGVKTYILSAYLNLSIARLEKCV